MRPKHITHGHIMRRYRCGLTEAQAILKRMVDGKQVEPVYSRATGMLIHYRRNEDSK